MVVDNTVTECRFCHIAGGTVAANMVLDEDEVLAFLDHRPLFPGHVLVVPRHHHRTLIDLPPACLHPFFEAVQRVAAAVTEAMGADGTFVAMNNEVSQSVPHLHVHVVPRRRKDVLRGFFWPRSRYGSEGEAIDIAQRIRGSLLRPPHV